MIEALKQGGYNLYKYKVKDPLFKMKKRQQGSKILQLGANTQKNQGFDSYE